jgi:hypothetical protein
MLLSRAVLDALLPPGSLWTPEDGAEFDALLEALAENAEPVRIFLDGLARVRSPQLTPFLSDLEKEYGILPDAALSEATRRSRLAAIKTAVNSTGAVPFLQGKLNAAGFDVQVHINNPPVNPAQFIDFAPPTVMGNASAVFNGVGAQFGGARGELLVNGPVYDAGVLVTYTTPTDPVYWPLVFFIGGDATRDPVTGEITRIERVTLPANRRAEFIALVIKYKPLYTWCGLVAEFVQIVEPDVNSFGFEDILFAFDSWLFAGEV